MFKIGRTILGLILLACIISATGCLNINKPPENQPKTEVNVGGDRGVDVNHHNDR
jgi:hypothetical protein